MSTPLQVKLRTAAIAYPDLAAALGGTDPDAFRWYDALLKPKSAFPAIVVTIISNPTTYSFSSRLSTSYVRVQFDLWETDPVALDGLVETLSSFLDQFNAYGITGLVQNGNYIRNDHQMTYPATQPPKYRRIVDVDVFNNSLTP